MSRAGDLLRALGQGSAIARDQRLRDQENSTNFLVQQMTRQQALKDAESGRLNLEGLRHQNKLEQIGAGVDAYGEKEQLRFDTNKKLQDEKFRYQKELKEIGSGDKETRKLEAQRRRSDAIDNRIDKYDKELRDIDIKMNAKEIRPGQSQYSAYKRSFDSLLKERNKYAKKYGRSEYSIDSDTGKIIANPSQDETKLIDDLASRYFKEGIFNFGDEGFDEQADQLEFERLLAKFPENVKLNKINSHRKANLKLDQSLFDVE